jgi:hypothetical protein
MRNRFIIIVLSIFTLGFAAAAPANAGTEIVRDYGGREVNRYAPPPPPPVYYPPPPVGVVVYPSYGFFGPRFRFVGVHRFDGRRVFLRSPHRFR